MTRLTTTQKSQLTNMNKAAQRGTLGTRIDELEYGTIADPDTGTITPMALIKYSIAPALGTATATKAAYTLQATPVTGVTSGITQPDYPRILTIKGNATMSGNVVIAGTDINDTVISDTIALNNSSEVAGTKAFKTVTSINFPAKTNESGDTVSIGRGNKYGLPLAVPNASTVIAATFDGSVDAGSVTATAVVATSLYAIAGTADGAKILSLILCV